MLKEDKMAFDNPGPSGVNHLQILSEQINEIAAQLQTSEQRRQQLETRINAMTQPLEQPTMGRESIDEFEQHDVNIYNSDETDITPDIPSGDQIQLESYKAIPEFSGKQHEYRSWRNQVARRMKIIDSFQKHVKYEAALAIVRAKITGAAADILTNNKTPYNIRSIIRILDSAYTDQRPLYAIEAQMVAIKQNERSLREFYNTINFALNAILTKISMAYKDINEQRSLTIEAQKKAIRTFIVGLKFRMMRHILYGQQPQTLQEAYAIAQTVFYDNEHLQLEQCTVFPGGRPQQRNVNNQRGANYANPPGNNMNWNQPRYNTPQPMEVDTSHRTRQAPNWRQLELPQKREYNSSRQRFEQPQKMQRVNHLLDTAIPEEHTTNNDSDDSTQTNGSSVFLEE